MARCPHCGGETPSWAGYCPTCGAARFRRNPSPEQPPLPFSPFGATAAAAQPAGAGGYAEPVVGPPLSTRQVVITVAAILLFLLAVVFLGQGWFTRAGTQPARTGAGAENLPVVGVKGELVEVGRTGWGVAFTEPMERFNDRAPQRGQFFAIGVVVANRGERDILLSDASLALLDDQGGERYTPVFTAWGTPEEFESGRYRERTPLPPQEALAGIIVFDTPRLTEPRLLVRDLTASSTAYTGVIDLTREKAQQQPGSNRLIDRGRVRMLAHEE